MTEHRRVPLLALLLCAAVSGCANTPPTPPEDVVRQTGDMLQRASELHFDDYAAPAMRLARSKYQAAQTQLLGKTPKQATTLAEEAQACVQLASVQASAARATANTLALRRQIDRLRALANPDAGSANTDSQGDAR